MFALRQCLHSRRAYATNASPSSMPKLAKVARTASTPLAVRLRRRKQFGPTASGASDATEDGLTPTDHARYTRLKAQGLLEGFSSPAEWAAQRDQHRSRVRGFRRKNEDGVQVTEVVGRKVYLPNIVFRLVRNHTPPGEPYNPYEATFRIPQSVTKTDVRSILQAVYGVKTTYIRTDNYISPWYRTQEGYERRPYKTYKRAVVGLVDPFYYPHRLEDMPEQERKQREEYIEKHFHIQQTRNMQKEELLRRTMGGGKASFKFKAPFATKRSHIIRLVAERRAKREGLIADVIGGIQALRESNEPVTYKNVKNVIQPIPPASDDAPLSQQ
ncbi:hypothetical protein CVT24_001512 [Panaeolus cyanescens]|uniref:Large ribosomal subunit protein uL23m n=1 Tax=Panaeolus cyanescens TaxID=181874 RepID=A0A409YFC3_9AGAR|nr:hypothetical protein CVT24_001512 [Panaeolus cyanescens]